MPDVCLSRHNAEQHVHGVLTKADGHHHICEHAFNVCPVSHTGKDDDSQSALDALHAAAAHGALDRGVALRADAEAVLRAPWLSEHEAPGPDQPTRLLADRINSLARACVGTDAQRWRRASLRCASACANVQVLCLQAWHPRTETHAIA